MQCKYHSATLHDTYIARVISHDIYLGTEGKFIVNEINLNDKTDIIISDNLFNIKKINIKPHLYIKHKEDYNKQLAWNNFLFNKNILKIDYIIEE